LQFFLPVEQYGCSCDHGYYLVIELLVDLVESISGFMIVFMIFDPKVNKGNIVFIKRIVVRLVDPVI
jgi:hypothetical protein